MKNQDWEDDYFERINPLDINENNLDKEEDDTEQQRKALREKWKNRKGYEEIELNEEKVIQDFIKSEGMEEDFEFDLEEATLKILEVSKIAKSFKYSSVRDKGEEEKRGKINYSKEKLNEAILALLKYQEKQEEKDILGNNQSISIIINHWSPFEKEIFHRFNLKNPIIKNPDYCILVPDEKKSLYKEKLNNSNIKIIKLTSFIKRYREFSKKIKLVGSYDYFLYDSEIEKEKILKLCGENFIRKHKLPYECSLENIENDLNFIKNSSKIQITKGSRNFETKIGKADMSPKEILENSIQFLDEVIKITKDDRKNILIRLENSPSLPFFSNSNILKISKKFKREEKWLSESNPSLKKQKVETKETQKVITKKIKK